MKNNEQQEELLQPKDEQLMEQQEQQKEKGISAEQKAELPVAQLDETIKALQAELAEKEKRIAELSDQYIRLMAEYDNYRKRSQKEKESIYEDCIVEMIRLWLPVIDNIDRAEFSADQYQSEEAKKIAEGISMIRKQIQDILDKLGVEVIDCCGKPFDPNLHDAIAHVEDDSVGASVVVEELCKGYKRADRIIRHSIVKVAN